VKRLLRRMPIFLASLSAVLFVATAAMWPRSYKVQDSAAWASRTTAYCILFNHGTLYVGRAREGPPGWFLASRPMSEMGEFPTWFETDHAWAGFHFLRSTYNDVFVGIPSWFVLLVLAAVCGGSLYEPGRRRRAQRAAGLCPSCGYDLRATPGRCPECGAVPEGRAAT
jgi:hypothetical protein